MLSLCAQSVYLNGAYMCHHLFYCAYAQLSLQQFFTNGVFVHLFTPCLCRWEELRDNREMEDYSVAVCTDAGKKKGAAPGAKSAR